MKPQITHRFMDPILYSSIRDTITGDTFYWLYQDYINFKPSKEFHFKTEIIKDSTLLGNQFINYLTMIKPAVELIPHKKIHSLSFRLLTTKTKKTEYEFNRFKKGTNVFVLFGNNSDGGININNEFIESSENTSVIFKSDDQLKFVFPVKDKITPFILLNYS